MNKPALLKIIKTIAKAFFVLVASLALVLVVAKFTGSNPSETLHALIDGMVGPHDYLRSLAKATPLILSGLGVAIALQAGMFNIGAEGQMLVGGLAAATVGFAFKSLPLVIHLPLALVAGILGGAAWAIIPGLLRAFRGAHEVIVTIMMNYIAISLMTYLVNGPLKDPNGVSKTPPIQSTAVLWSMGNSSDFSAGFFLAVVACIAASYVIKRTVFGYRIRAVGHSASVSEANGINVKKTMVTAMTISGALAGLAGAIEVLGVAHKFTLQFSAGYGFDSIAVALLGSLEPAGVFAAALLFGALRNGARNLHAETSTPEQIAGIVQGVIILAVGIRKFPLLQRILKRG